MPTREEWEVQPKLRRENLERKEDEIKLGRRIQRLKKRDYAGSKATVAAVALGTTEQHESIRSNTQVN